MISVHALLLLLSVTGTSSFEIPTTRRILAPRATKRTPKLWSTKKSSTSEFLNKFFSSSECDDVNTPPSLSVTLRSLDLLANGSDIRGTFVDHPRVGSFASIGLAISRSAISSGSGAALTPLAAHCLGYAFATMLQERRSQHNIEIVLANDPRSHGPRLVDAFSRGAQSVSAGVTVKYTGIGTTPAMMDFIRSDLCDGAVILTASHLPSNRNGMKCYVKNDGGFTKTQVKKMIDIAKAHAQEWQTMGIMPPTSGEGGVFCSEWVDYMPTYAKHLSDSIRREVKASSDNEKPLAGLKIVLNSGNGSGGFFNQVLQDLGADMSCSIHQIPDGSFPHGVPNPESQAMVDETLQQCRDCQADLGIMLDTDADRSGFIVPNDSSAEQQHDYVPLNRNRLIALLGVIFAETSPGCTFVTDSTTSEGLSHFLQDQLGLGHCRYLKGYANVIQKARELSSNGSTVNAEVAVETSGHCAMKENDFSDDGTYTAIKVIGLLARMKTNGNDDDDDCNSILDLIRDMKEMPERAELRMRTFDGSVATTSAIFDPWMTQLKDLCNDDDANLDWSVDTENLEGLRVRTDSNGGFFMLRQSLHDPVIILEIEGETSSIIREKVIAPLLESMHSFKAT